MKSILKAETTSSTGGYRVISNDQIYAFRNFANTANNQTLKLSTISGSLENGDVESVLWVNRKDQLADCPTEKGASMKIYLKGLIGKIKLY